MLGQAGVALGVPRVRPKMPGLPQYPQYREGHGCRASVLGSGDVRSGGPCGQSGRGLGQPPPVALFTLYFCATCLPAVGQWVDQCLQTEAPAADASVGEAQATSPSARVSPVHTGEPNAAPFCFLGILMTSPG